MEIYFIILLIIIICIIIFYLFYFKHKHIDNSYLSKDINYDNDNLSKEINYDNDNFDEYGNLIINDKYKFNFKTGGLYKYKSEKQEYYKILSDKEIKEQDKLIKGKILYQDRELELE